MRYYSTQRPIGPGTFPRIKENPVCEIINYDKRVYIPEINRMAWGEIRFSAPLSKIDADDYELVIAPEGGKE